MNLGFYNSGEKDVKLIDMKRWEKLKDCNRAICISIIVHCFRRIIRHFKGLRTWANLMPDNWTRCARQSLPKARVIVIGDTNGHHSS